MVRARLRSWRWWGVDPFAHPLRHLRGGALQEAASGSSAALPSAPLSALEFARCVFPEQQAQAEVKDASPRGAQLGFILVSPLVGRTPHVFCAVRLIASVQSLGASWRGHSYLIWKLGWWSLVWA